MEVRTLDSEAALERALELTARAWREAFDHVLSDEELERVERALLSDVPERYEALRNGSTSTVLVAEDAAGDVVGWTSVLRHPERTRAYVEEGEAEIRTLYVSPDRWGEGTGTALLEEVLRRLPDSVDRVVLETFRENEQGRSFYEARGFTVRATTDFEVAGSEYPSVVLVRER